MPSASPAADAEPSSNDVGAIWAAYALQATGALGFLLGPLIGLVISYLRRNAAGAGFIASHHRWLIRTFWWTALGYLMCLAVILAGAWPIVGGLVHDLLRNGAPMHSFSVSVAWESLFAGVGAAMMGGLGMVVVWIWNWYRIVRGGIQLAYRSPVP